MAAHDFAVTHSSAIPNWRTEDALYTALDDEFDISWDAAATESSCRAMRTLRSAQPYFGPDHRNDSYRDALAVFSWREVTGNAAIFCNPPSSRETGDRLDRWFAKFEEQAILHGATIVAVVPHRPSERYWKHTRSAVEIRQIPHRVRYWLPVDELAAINAQRALEGRKAIKTGSNAGFPTAVVIWRPQPGIIQPATPRVVTWTYRGATK